MFGEASSSKERNLVYREPTRCLLTQFSYQSVFVVVVLLFWAFVNFLVSASIIEIFVDFLVSASIYLYPKAP